MARGLLGQCLSQVFVDENHRHPLKEINTTQVTKCFAYEHNTHIQRQVSRTTIVLTTMITSDIDISSKFIGFFCQCKHMFFNVC